MKLVFNYESALNDIAQHVGFPGYLGSYTLSFGDIDCFYHFSAENKELLWATDKEDVENESGEHYQEDCKGIYRGEELTLAIISSSFGDDDYGIMFKTKNEIL